MASQLKWKFVFIAVVVLACLFGLIGMPDLPTSLGKVKDNLTDRIKLGLDFRLAVVQTSGEASSRTVKRSPTART